MRCDLCEGSGMRPSPGGLAPCPECGGCGVSHCCDGLVACGEIEGDVRFERKVKQDRAASGATRSINTTRDHHEIAGFKP